MLKKLKALLKINRGFALIWESSRKWAIWGLLVMFVLGSVPVVSLYLHKLIVDAITGTVTGKESVAIEVVVGLIIGFASVEVFLALLRSVISAGNWDGIAGIAQRAIRCVAAVRSEG